MMKNEKKLRYRSTANFKVGFLYCLLLFVIFMALCGVIALILMLLGQEVTWEKITGIIVVTIIVTTLVVNRFGM